MTDLRLHTNPFSPFARKVHLVMEHKGLRFDLVDGLARGARSELALVNGRVEVPVLEHDGLTVVNSADIVAYLERVFPQDPVYPTTPAGYVKARAWERCSDTTVDGILINISYWIWAIRHDSMPDGLLDAARQDMEVVYQRLEDEIADGDWICGELSVADFALFPQLSGTRMLGVPFDGDRYPGLLAWYKRCRSTSLFQADLERLKSYLSAPGELDVEREKIFWRGDRIEWMLARGQHDWFMREIEEDRVLWPGLGVPTKRKPIEAPT